MLGFDPRSFIVISTCLGLLCGFVCFILRRSFPSDIKGLNCWGFACLVMVLASVLFSARGSLGIAYSRFAANIFVVTGIALMLHSLRQFIGGPPERHYEFLVILAVAILLVWPTFFDDDYRFRIVIVSTANAAMFMASAFLISRIPDKSFAEYFTQAIFVMTALVSLSRCVVALTSPQTVHPLTDSSSIQYLYLATFSISIFTLSLGFIMMINRKLQLNLQGLAFQDGLTGVLTRKAFFDAANREIEKGRRSGEHASLLIIDLDDFKSINDRFGHLGGDQVLIDFVAKTRKVLHAQDVFGRFGGEEFVVLLPATDETKACDVAERIRIACQHQGSTDAVAFTVSIGLTTIEADANDVTPAFARADRALYKAKACGKNRIESHCPAFTIIERSCPAAQ